MYRIPFERREEAQLFSALEMKAKPSGQPYLRIRLLKCISTTDDGSVGKGFPPLQLCLS